MFAMLYRGDEQTTRGWLTHATPLVLNCLIGDAFFVNLAIDGARPDIRIARGLLAPHAKTQSGMNRAYVVDADVWLAFRLQLAAKIILLTLMFSSAMPALLAVVALFCWAAHLVDKWVLFRQMRRPPHTQSLRLMYYMTCWLLPFAVIVRLGFGVFVFLGLRCGCDDEAALIAAGVLGGAGAPLLPTTPLRPVQTVVVVSSCLLGVCMLGFVIREAIAVWNQRDVRHTRKRSATRASIDGTTPIKPLATSQKSVASAAAPNRLSEAISVALKPTGEQRPPTRSMERTKSINACIRKSGGGRSTRASGGGSARCASNSAACASEVGSARCAANSAACAGEAGGAGVSTKSRTVSFKAGAMGGGGGGGLSAGAMGGGGGGGLSAAAAPSGRSARSSHPESATRSRAGTANSTANSTASNSNGRALSLSRTGSFVDGIRRPRSSSATGLGRYVLPDVAQMYLPPLTNEIMKKLVVLHPVHAQRAKMEMARRRSLQADGEAVRALRLSEEKLEAIAASVPVPPRPTATSAASVGGAATGATPTTRGTPSVSREEAGKPRLSSMTSRLGVMSRKNSLEQVRTVSIEALERTSHSAAEPTSAELGAAEPPPSAEDGITRLLSNRLKSAKI
jgi:hypothetical protein